MAILINNQLTEKQGTYLKKILHISTCILSSERTLLENVIRYDMYYKTNAFALNKIVQEFEMELTINKIYDL